ncbi:hypothetical protein BKI52_29190 [marine bacterium AO1-C]|nr:hypothetical protein BKI52_29190 [marine bacterium AO1-C]
MTYSFLMVFVILPAKAQFQVQGRYEIPVTRNLVQEEFEVISLKQKGLFFLAKREKWRSPEVNWEMTRIDTTLKEAWKVTYQLPLLFEPIDMYYDQKQYMYFLLTRYEKKAFKILKVNIQNGQVEKYDGKLPLKASLTKLRATQDYIFLIGSFQSNITALRYNTLDGSTKIVPSVYSKTFNQIDVFTQKDINTGFFLMANSRLCQYKASAYSNIVGMQASRKLEFPKRYNFHAATLYPLNATESLVLGTYSRRCQPYPQGIATVLIKNGQQGKTRLNKFIDYRNYFNYHSPKKVKRIRERILKKAAKGKDYILGSKMALSDVIEMENSNNILVLAERYWYRNKAIPPTSLGRGSMPLTQERGNYQFNSASVSAFNRKGIKQWDNTIKLKHGVTAEELKTQVRIGFQGDSVILAYMRQRREGVTPTLCTKFIYKHKTLKEETEEEVANMDENDKIFSSNDQHFMHWYGDVFILWGEQTVVNRYATGSQTRREVAFVNKLRFNKHKVTEKEKKKLARKKKESADNKEREEKKK